MSEWIDVIEKDKLDYGAHHTLIAKGHPIAVFNVEGEYFAIEDCCTHQAFPLSDGFIEGDEITCPFHGAKFSLRTGEVRAPPAFEDVKTYEVRVQHGMIQVKV